MNVQQLVTAGSNLVRLVFAELEYRASGTIYSLRMRQAGLGHEGMGKLAAREKTVKSEARAKKSASVTKIPEGTSQTHVGDALRSIYQETVEEEVPQEFLDILGKLA